MRAKLLTLGCVALCLAANVHAQSPCPAQGLGLSVQGGRMGDVWSIALTGAPLAPGYLAFDVAGGPLATPLGSVCVGLTPALQLLPIVLNGSGVLALGGAMPMVPASEGTSLFLQAICADTSQPQGIALSNGAEVTLFRPRMYFVNPGSATPFGVTPGGLTAVDATNDSVSYAMAATSSIRDVATSRARRELVVLQGDGTLRIINDLTGGLVLSVALTGGAAGAIKMLPSQDGQALLLLNQGSPPNPFSGGTPGSLHVVQMSTGAVVTNIPLASGNPDALLAVQYPNHVALRSGNGIVLVDYAAGFAYPQIALPTTQGPLVDWQSVGNTLYCLHGGQQSPFGGGTQPAVSMVDLPTQSLITTAILNVAAPASLLRAGPGGTGPSLYAYCSSIGQMLELAQGSLVLTNTMPAGGSVTAFELSALNSEWLMVCNGFGCVNPSLQSFPVGSVIAQTAVPLPVGTQTALAVCPSTLAGKAYMAYGTNVSLPIPTDPLFAPVQFLSLPTTASTFIIRSN